MEWSDEGIVLAARRHGESGVIVTLLTRAHGRHAGLVRGGTGRRSRGVYEPGNRVQATWRARLSEHLGGFACELLESPSASLLDQPLRLAGLAAAVAVAEAALPEREPHPAVFDRLRVLLHLLAVESPSAEWAAAYVRWELALLAELGFGLDLSRCAATGTTENLAFVSPRTGRAVSAQAAAPYLRQLLALPRFLRDPAAAASPSDVATGLALTGHFLRRHVFAHGQEHGPARAEEPAARTRLVARLRQLASDGADTV